MDGNDSYFYQSPDAAIDHILSSDQKVAYFHDLAFINSLKKTHCKVLTYLQASTIPLKNKTIQ